MPIEAVLPQVIIGGDAGWTYAGILLIAFGFVTLATALPGILTTLSLLVFGLAGAALFGFWPFLFLPLLPGLLVLMALGLGAGLIISGGFMVYRGLNGAPTTDGSNPSSVAPVPPSQGERKSGSTKRGTKGQTEMTDAEVEDAVRKEMRMNKCLAEESEEYCEAAEERRLQKELESRNPPPPKPPPPPTPQQAPTPGPTREVLEGEAEEQ